MPVLLDTYSAWDPAQGLDEAAGPDETKEYDETLDVSVFLDDIFGPHTTGTHGMFTGTTVANVGVGRVRVVASVVVVGVSRLGIRVLLVTVDVLGRQRIGQVAVETGVSQGSMVPLPVWAGVKRVRQAPLRTEAGARRARPGAMNVLVAKLLGDPEATLLLWNDASTDAYGLASSFALDEQSIETTRPVFAPTGARALLASGIRRAQPRTVRISGIIRSSAVPLAAWEDWHGLMEHEGPDESQGFDEADDGAALLSALFGAHIDASADGLARQIRGVLMRSTALLERASTPGRVLRLRAVRVSTDLNRGRYAGTVRTLTIDAEAPDPFWYAVQPVTASFAASSSGQMFTVTNPGTVPGQPVAVVFTARQGTVINPALTNVRNGLVVRFNGTLTAGQSVTLDARDRAAVFGDGSNALPRVERAWCERGFALEPGENVLTYADDPTSSHACDVTVVWTPAWW